MAVIWMAFVFFSYHMSYTGSYSYPAWAAQGDMLTAENVPPPDGQSSVPSVGKHPVHWSVLENHTELISDPFPTTSFPILTALSWCPPRSNFPHFSTITAHFHSNCPIYRLPPLHPRVKILPNFWTSRVGMNGSGAADLQLTLTFDLPLEESSKTMCQAVSQSYIINFAMTCLICKKSLSTTTCYFQY